MSLSDPHVSAERISRSTNFRMRCAMSSSMRMPPAAPFPSRPAGLACLRMTLAGTFKPTQALRVVPVQRGLRANGAISRGRCYPPAVTRKGGRSERNVLKAIVTLGSAAAVLLQLVGAPSARAAFPGCPGLIAFDSDRSGIPGRYGDREIWTMSPDGTHAVRRTFNTVADVVPNWSADGKQLVFARGPRRYHRLNYDIYLMSFDGEARNLTNLPTANDYNPAWSPDGTKIVFTSDRDGNYETYVMNADGSDPVNVTNDPAKDQFPDWSPDGARIVEASDRTGNREIYTMSPDGTGLTQLTFDPEIDSYPNWAPNGTRIVFQRKVGEWYDLFLMNADGTDQVNLTNDAIDEQHPTWSPDGSKILFERYRDTARELFTLDLSTLAITQLTFNSAIDQHPDWQPVPC